MDRRNNVEWAILAASLIAVVGLVGFLIVDGVTDAGRPPSPLVALHPERAYAITTGWLLPATARNNGDKSAQSVALRATATVNGETEEAEVSIDYLPAGTEVEVTFGFSAEPDGDVLVRITGFVP